MKMIRKRKRSYDKAKTTNNRDHWRMYKKLRNDTISLVRNSKKHHEDTVSAELNSGSPRSSNWWSTMKTRIKPARSTSIPPLKHPDSIFSDGNDKANMFNTVFASQTQLADASRPLPELDMDPDRPKLDNLLITPPEAAGPDGITNRILKELSSQLSKPLCDIFNISLYLAQVPTLWKEASVCAIFKKGDPSDVSNYRPISLLCTMEKVMEKIIHKHMFNFLNTNNCISALQSGFVPNDSTVNQLVDLYNTFGKALDDGKGVRSVYCDISKAFDKVWHRGLVLKLQVTGITGYLLSWLTNYLQGRKQRVVLPGHTSDIADIYAGVPQGSILGPLLFLVYINDIVNNITSTIKLFADVVDDPNQAADCLNTDLGRIQQWANKWMVIFNPSKTESLLISRKTNTPQHPPLLMNHSAIQ
ncbi:MAG: reverse transcriptase family protein [Sedimenticola sp.]